MAKPITDNDYRILFDELRRVMYRARSAEGVTNGDVVRMLDVLKGAVEVLNRNDPVARVVKKVAA